MKPPTLVLLPLLAAAPAPQMPDIKGMPGMSNAFARGGPPWRKATEKVFNEACQMNRGQPSVFCYPDMKELLEGLSKASEYGADFTSETFLLDIHVVVEQLLGWPSAWTGVNQVLASRHQWSRHYCDKILGDSPIWYAPPLVRKSFITPRSTIAQIEKDQPYVAAAFSRYLEELGKNGDGKTKELIRVLKANDVADIKSKSVHARPMMRLMMHEHAKVLKFILGKACKGSKKAWAKFERQDLNGLTIVHHVASQGNTAAVEAILRAAPKPKRQQLASTRDGYGYLPEDWAALGDFNDTVAALRKWRGDEEAVSDIVAPAEPLKLFREAGSAAADPEECPASDASCGSGGWRQAELSAVPAEWLPGPEAPCAIDTILASQFDIDTFLRHYLLHPRPLLIKGAGKPDASSAGNWTRAGLLAAAGERKVEAELFPRAQAFDGTRPLKMSLREYLELMDNRSADLSFAKKKLQYGYLPLDVNEVYLNFSAVLPEVLNGQVDHKGTVFLLGGVLSGTPPHHHGPSANSLVYGTKLWFLDPPGREIVAHEPIYDYLKRSKGACSTQQRPLLNVDAAVRSTGADLTLKP
ncbi:JMJD8 [Symbiodinium natans]|uniref:JMJD8 protein n=1 Tax=Symbiodinium natans TaxID=878477 RepID=A0A812LMB4_9DINO|nr:JMJD8 [Symbiodinium natans]